MEITQFSVFQGVLRLLFMILFITPQKRFQVAQHNRTSVQATKFDRNEPEVHRVIGLPSPPYPLQSSPNKVNRLSFSTMFKERECQRKAN